jgi:uncharacterized protein (TIGR02391 family)
MATSLDLFEQFARKTLAPTSTNDEPPEINGTPAHPFELRNVHPGFPAKVRKLFDNGHCAEATFHAFKFIEKVVQKHSGNTQNGRKLMMAVFNKDNPLIKLNSLSNASELDEQEGYSFVFAGAIMAIRNPGGHEIELSDDPDICLDHLTFGTLLLRRLERSGFKTT